VYVRYYWEPCAGVEYIDSKTAAQLAGTDPDAASRDLFDTIAAGHTVEYELRVQTIIVEFEDDQPFDILDPTLIWPEHLFPLIPVGRLVLNKNPENYFAEVEQSAFSPAAIVPGIDFSNDRVLQGRIFPYGDTQRHRIGVNYLELPVNMPRNPVDNKMQDGPMRSSHSQDVANYLPNTLSGGAPVEAPSKGNPPQEYVAGCVGRQEIAGDDYYQPGCRYRDMSALEKKHLVSNIVESLRQAYEPIQRRMIEHFRRTDEELGRRIAQELNLML
jgi:catalase